MAAAPTIAVLAVIGILYGAAVSYSQKDVGKKKTLEDRHVKKQQKAIILNLEEKLLLFDCGHQRVVDTQWQLHFNH